MGIGADVDLHGQLNESAATAHGWSTTNTFTRGVSQEITTGALWRDGDWVLLKCNFFAGKLAMVSSRNTTPWQIVLSITASMLHEYEFHIMLFCDRDEIELLPVTARDKQLFEFSDVFY